MKKRIFLSLLSVTIFACLQTNKRPKIGNFETKISPSILNEFIPNDHEIIDKQIGDLNNDGFSDVLLITQLKNCEDVYLLDSNSYKSEGLTYNRTLSILTFNQKNQIKSTISLDNVVLPCSIGVGWWGDFSECKIKNNSFEIQYYSGMCRRIGHNYKFKYFQAKNTWKLISFYQYEHGACGNTEENVIIDTLGLDIDSLGIIDLEHFNYNNWHMK